MKKILRILTILICIPILVNAKANENVDYEVEHMYISANLDFLGSLHVEEAIITKGDINKFTREIDYKDSSLDKWEPKKVDFKKSSFYNGRGFSLKRVSSLSIKEKDINFNVLSKFAPFSQTKYKEYSEVKSAKKGDTGKYTNTKNDNGNIITIYNPSNSDYTLYYLEYYVDQVAVLHKDVAELYYKFIPNNFDDIKNLDIQFVTPGYSSKDVFKFWAHGSLNGSIAPISDKKDKESNDLYNGVLAKFKDVKNGADIRVTFDKDLLSMGKQVLNNSEENALKKIEKLENGNTDTSNKTRKLNKVMLYVSLVISIIYLAFGIVLLIMTIKNFYTKKSNKYATSIDEITACVYFVLGIILIGFSLYFNIKVYIINGVSLIISLIYLLMVLRFRKRD